MTKSVLIALDKLKQYRKQKCLLVDQSCCATRNRRKTQNKTLQKEKTHTHKHTHTHLWNPCSVLHIHDQETLLEMYYVQDTFKLLLFSLKMIIITFSATLKAELVNNIALA